MTSLKRRVFTKNLSESFGAEVWVISAIFWKIHMERTILANYLEVTGRKAEVYYTNNNPELFIVTYTTVPGTA